MNRPWSPAHHNATLKLAGGQVVGGAAGGGLADAISDAVPYGLLAAGCLVTLVLTRGARERVAA